MLPINESVAELPLHLVLKTGSIWWMQLQQQVWRAAGAAGG